MLQSDFSVQKDFVFDHTTTNNTDNIPTYNFGSLPISANQGDIAFERNLTNSNLLGKLKYFDGTMWRDSEGEPLTVGPVNAAPTPNGADITNNEFHLHPASTTSAGVVLPTPQVLGGDKTLSNAVFITDPTFPVSSAPVPVSSPYFPTVINSTTGKLGSLASFPGSRFSKILTFDTGGPQIFGTSPSSIVYDSYPDDGYIEVAVGAPTDVLIKKTGVYITHLAYNVNADPGAPVEFKTRMVINGGGSELSYLYMGTAPFWGGINKSLNCTFISYLSAGDVVRIDMASSVNITMGLGDLRFVYMFGEQASV